MPSVRFLDWRVAAFGILVIGSVNAGQVAQASDLGELRQRLASLQGREPIRADVEVRVEVIADGREEPAVTTASASVEADRDGVQIAYPRAILDEIAQRAATPREDEDGDPPPEAIEQLAGPTVDKLLDFAGELDSWLARSIVVESDGNRLRLEVQPIPQDGLVKVVELTLELTLQDGLPRLARTRRVSRGGVLILKVTNEEILEHELEIAGDRLVVTRRAQTMDVSGLGMSFHQVGEIVLTVTEPSLPAPATDPR